MTAKNIEDCALGDERASLNEPFGWMPKRNYSAPVASGEKLIDPASDQLNNLWQSNLKHLANLDSVAMDQSDLATLQATARSELVRSAIDYSAQYLDRVDPRFAETNTKPIVMAGHQPTLFHPGVWLKNFFLSQQSDSWNAIAVNLIIDNDLCESRIQIPTGNGTPERIADIEINAATENCPFEGARIANLEQFRSVGAKIEQLIKPLVANPIICNLWPEIIRASERLEQNGSVNLGQAIAAGRHRLESKLGLKTLEIPISWLSRSRSFAQFTWQMLSAADRFLTIHNQGLLEYRQRFHLRSRTHPFPQLDQHDDWFETPFWVVHDSATRRKPVFARNRSDGLQLSDLDGWILDGLKDSIGLFQRIEDGSVQLRPRAVVTTLYSRLVLCDLFVHGIGGGKYDQLTDWIAAQFWKIRLPDYCVVSATYKLFPNLPSIDAAQIGMQKQQIRELEMNPDKFLVSEGTTLVPENVQSAIDRKRALVQGNLSRQQAEKTQLEKSKERHAAIAECNRILQLWTEPLKAELISELDRNEKRFQQEQAFGSREFSFCLHPIELTEQLLKC